ncbi:MAG: NAD(P) transhydrogenase subunit alpha [Leptospiraceae bacterium]|nr:NAD(P) transhydrogenase subunit alpha [Leptospiraceae bacterium]MCB1317976.1 NAD(P) transhydrogenase subunit alpha [Leptospiraceae bacterium]
MSIIISITILVLSVFLGFELISKVPPTLHTPLMSGCNAISGVTLVGAVLSAGYHDFGLFTIGSLEVGMSSLLGFLAVVFATINVVGGFLVTDRMHRMFTKKK